MTSYYVEAVKALSIGDSVGIVAWLHLHTVESQEIIKRRSAKNNPIVLFHIHINITFLRSFVDGS